MTIEQMKKIAEARTEYQSWKDFYNDCTEENAKFAEMAANNWDKLMAVVEAAHDYVEDVSMKQLCVLRDAVNALEIE